MATEFNLNKFESQVKRRIDKEVIQSEVFEQRLILAYETIEERVKVLNKKYSIDLNSDYEKILLEIKKEAQEITAEETVLAFTDVLKNNYLEIFTEEFEKTDLVTEIDLLREEVVLLRKETTSLRTDLKALTKKVKDYHTKSTTT